MAESIVLKLSLGSSSLSRFVWYKLDALNRKTGKADMGPLVQVKRRKSEQRVVTVLLVRVWMKVAPRGAVCDVM